MGLNENMGQTQHAYSLASLGTALFTEVCCSVGPGLHPGCSDQMNTLPITCPCWRFSTTLKDWRITPSHYASERDLFHCCAYRARLKCCVVSHVSVVVQGLTSTLSKWLIWFRFPIPSQCACSKGVQALGSVKRVCVCVCV